MYLAIELVVVFIIELVLIMFIESKRDKYREVLVIRPSKKYYFVGVLGSLFSIWTYHFMINISQNDLERKLSVIAAVFLFVSSVALIILRFIKTYSCHVDGSDILIYRAGFLKHKYSITDLKIVEQKMNGIRLLFNDGKKIYLYYEYENTIKFKDLLSAKGIIIG